MDQYNYSNFNSNFNSNPSTQYTIHYTLQYECLIHATIAIISYCVTLILNLF